MSSEMMAHPISTCTARDMVRGILEQVDEIPNMPAAEKIAEEYCRRGVWIRPEYLMDVWMDMWGGQKND